MLEASKSVVITLPTYGPKHLVSVNETCKSTTMVDLRTFQWPNTIAQPSYVLYCKGALGIGNIVSILSRWYMLLVFYKFEYHWTCLNIHVQIALHTPYVSTLWHRFNPRMSIKLVYITILYIHISKVDFTLISHQFHHIRSQQSYILTFLASIWMQFYSFDLIHYNCKTEKVEFMSNNSYAECWVCKEKISNQGGLTCIPLENVVR